MPDLARVLVDARRAVIVLRENGCTAEARAKETLLDDVERVTLPFRRWLSESAAMVRSGLTRTQLRRRVPEWERLDPPGARRRREGRTVVYEYLQHVVPQRTHDETLEADAARAALQELSA